MIEMFSGILIGSQFVFTIIATIYFYTNLKSQKGIKKNVVLESKNELGKLKRLREIKLTEPLSETTRPANFNEIIGQQKGIRALRASICGKNPQHVIIYGPPGVGKTAAARLILQECINNEDSPFKKESPFIEMDATILQFDERSIADPLIGSVHEPIYQGAGAFGQAGVPQPKAGAVTKAHGGILFIDEIGELHNLQMNKLLKVLEDRVVYLTSAYYSSEEKNIPRYIHDIFKNGFPADFRLIAATTRKPEEIPPALRSRCTEIFFRSLNYDEVMIITMNAIKKTGLSYEEGVPELISNHSTNGRDTVNIVQTAVSIASIEKRNKITVTDIEEIIENGKYYPNIIKRANKKSQIGVVNGLAVTGNDNGILLEIEVITSLPKKNIGILKITGVIDEEEINNGNSKLKRKSTARSSVENIITVLNKMVGVNIYDYDVHINFPGGMPIDGPSAGIAVFSSILSSITNREISGNIAMTGEISIKGKILPVGGVYTKLETAKEAGIKKVIIPKGNYQKSFESFGLDIICVETIFELMKEVFKPKDEKINIISIAGK